MKPKKNAKQQNARIGRRYMPVNDIKVMSVMLQSQDIATWTAAINQARSEVNPRRRQLYELYLNIILDGHLTSVMNKRYLSIANKKVLWITDDGADAHPDIKYLLNAPWFLELRKYAIEAVAWGHSLVEMLPGDDGWINRVKLMPRINVRPEEQYGWLLKNYGADTPRINFRTDVSYLNNLIEFGGYNNLGLLMQAAQYVIYKRGGFGDWAQFAELFGMPFRAGYYNPYDDNMRRKLDEGLNAMGGAGYAVLPDGSRLEFFQNSGTGASEVFENMIQKCNEEISKIFLGQTMTTENGSSLSQSKVHKDVEDQIMLGDIIMIEHELNYNLKPKLLALGYPLDGGRFVIDDTPELDLNTMLSIMQGVNQKVPLRKSDWYEKFNLSPPEDGEDTTEPMVNPLMNPNSEPPPDDEEEPDDAPEKKKSVAEAHYDLFYVPEAVAELDFDGLTDDEKNLILRIKDMREGTVKYDQTTFLNTVSKLREALFKSINSSTAVEYGSPDNVARTMMEVNIHRFGFDKTIAQVMELNLALNESSGFNDFRKRAAQICENYNRNYLRTEYDTAISVGQNASAWNRFKKEQNLYPYLKYQTAGDSRVRPKHAALDGKVFRIDDTSWRAIYPPNGYNCRCEMIQLSRDEVTPADEMDGEQAKAALGEEWSKMVKSGFASNRGETNEVFDLNKTYLAHIADKDMEKRLGEKAIEMSDIDYKYLGYPSYSDMDKTNLSKISRDTLTSPEQMLKDFDHTAKEINGKPTLVLPDYAGRTVGITRDNFQHHMTIEKHIEQERDKLFTNVKDILQHPDEVWMTEVENTTRYHYIRFYKDGIMAIQCDVNNTTTINTWYKLYDTKLEGRYRKGILVYKKIGG